MGLTDPAVEELEPIIYNDDGTRELNPALKEYDTFLIWTEPGTIELNEENSKKAVGKQIAGSFN